MMPARYRGRVDVMINGTYWAGSVLGTFSSLLLLNSLPQDVAWRVAFLVGPVLAVVVLFVRRNLPESPRWLLTHGHEREAQQIMERIEQTARDSGQILAPVDDERDALTLRPEGTYGYLVFLRLVFRTYPGRAALAATLMIAQSFLYNAIFFTYALVLTKFYGVDAAAPSPPPCTGH
ncbi:MFS transporter [Streptomyces sp. NPDC059009]|uniref:MFS transporter n=1 Tax=Streptomyces sp. NPDC059009 TaxID=3346694 RepID=UPI0036CEB4BD